MAEKKPNCEQPNPNESRNTTPKLDPNDPSIKRPERNMPADKSAKGSQDIRGYSQPSQKKIKTLGSFNSTAKNYEELYLEAMASKKNPSTVSEITEREEKNLNEVGQTYEADGKRYVDIKDTQNRDNKSINDVNVPQTRKFKYQEFEENVIHRTKVENAVEIEIDRPQKYKEETFNTTQAQKGREDVVIPTNERSIKFDSGAVDRVHQSKDSNDISSPSTESSPKSINEKEFKTTAPTSSPKEDSNVTPPPYQTNYKVYNAQNITANIPTKSPKDEESFNTNAPVTSPKNETGPDVKSTEGSIKTNLNVETNLKSKVKSEEDVNVKDPNIEKSEEDVNVKDPGIEKDELNINTDSKYWVVKDEIPTEPKDPKIEKDELNIETDQRVNEKEGEDLGVTDPGIEKSEFELPEENSDMKFEEKPDNKDADLMDTGSIEYNGNSGYRINILKEDSSPNEDRKNTYNKVGDSGEQMQWEIGPNTSEFTQGLEVVSNINRDGQSVNKHFDYSQSNSQSRYGNSVRYEKDDSEREEFPGQSDQYFRDYASDQKIRSNIDGPIDSRNTDNPELINRNTNYSTGDLSTPTSKINGITGELAVWSNYDLSGVEDSSEVGFTEAVEAINSNYSEVKNDNVNFTRDELHTTKTNGTTNEDVVWTNYDMEGINPHILDEETEPPVLTNKDVTRDVINRNSNYDKETIHSKKLDGSVGTSSEIIWTNYSVDGTNNPNDVGDNKTPISTWDKKAPAGQVFVNRNIDYVDYEVREILDILGVGEVTISEIDKAKSTLKLTSDELTEYKDEYFNITEDKEYIPKLDTELSSNYKYYDSDIDKLTRIDAENKDKRNSKDVITTDSNNLINRSTLWNSKIDSYTKYEGTYLQDDGENIDPLISTNYSYYDRLANGEITDKITRRNSKDDITTENNEGEELINASTFWTSKLDSYTKNEETDYSTKVFANNSRAIDPLISTNYSYSKDYTHLVKLDGSKDDSTDITWGDYSLVGNVSPNVIDESYEAVSFSRELINRNINFNSILEQNIEEGTAALKNSIETSFGDPQWYEARDNALADYFGLGFQDYGKNDYRMPSNVDISESRKNNRDIYYSPSELYLDLDFGTQIITTIAPDVGRAISSLQSFGETVQNALSLGNNIVKLLDNSEGKEKYLGNISNQGSETARKLLVNTLSRHIGAHFRSRDIYDPEPNWTSSADAIVENIDRKIRDWVNPLDDIPGMPGSEGPNPSQFQLDQITRGVGSKSSPWDFRSNNYFYGTGSLGLPSIGGEKWELTDNIAKSPSHLPFDQDGGISKLEKYRGYSLASYLVNSFNDAEAINAVLLTINNTPADYEDISKNLKRLKDIDGLENTDLYKHSPFDLNEYYRTNNLGYFIPQFVQQNADRRWGSSETINKIVYDINTNRADYGGSLNLPVDKKEGGSTKDFRAININRKPFSGEIEGNSLFVDFYDSDNNYLHQASLINKLYNGLDDSNSEIPGGNRDLFKDVEFNPTLNPINFADTFKIDNEDFYNDEEFSITRYMSVNSPLHASHNVGDSSVRVYSNNFVTTPSSLVYERRNFFTGEVTEDETDPHLILYNYKVNEDEDKNRNQHPGSYIGARGSLSKLRDDSDILDHVLFLGNLQEDNFNISDLSLFGRLKSDEEGTENRRDYFAIKSTNQNFYDNLFANSFGNSGTKTINYQGSQNIQGADPHTMVVDKVSGVGGRYVGEDGQEVENGGTTYGGKDAFYKFLAGEHLKNTFAQVVGGTESVEDSKVNILQDGLSEFLKNEVFNVKTTDWKYGENDKMFYSSLRDRKDTFNFHSNFVPNSNDDPHFIDYVIKAPEENSTTADGENTGTGHSKSLDLLNGKGEMLAFAKTNNSYKTLFNHIDGDTNTSVFSNLSEIVKSKNYNFIVTNGYPELVRDDRDSRENESISNFGPRYSGYSVNKSDKSTQDQRYSVKDDEDGVEINPLIANMNEVRVYSVPTIDGNDPDPDQIGWHLSDPANATDYDTLTDEEIKKASIGYAAGEDPKLNLNFFPNGNKFDTLFDSSNPLGLIGKKQELGDRAWDDPAVPSGGKRPFALKKPLRIDNFYEPKRSKGGDPTVKENVLDRTDSPRLDRGEPGMGIQEADPSNASHKRDNMLANMSNKGKYFYYIKDDGDAFELNEHDQGDGYIAALEDPQKSIGDPTFVIPFQFAAELSGEQRAADWATETAIGRTAEWYLWSRTNTRTLQLKTSYVVTAPSSPGSDRSITDYGEDGPDRNMSFLSSWNQEKVSDILNKYRSLILPISTASKSLFLPPTIVIVMNNYLLTSYQNSGGTQTKKLSRWVAQDINIDPKYDFGLTATRDPIAYDINITFKEVFPWSTIQTWDTIKNNLLNVSGE